MDILDINEVKLKYDSKKSIWPLEDKWHLYTYRTIKSFIEKHTRLLCIDHDSVIINLGSGGNPYCFDEKNMLHVDFIDKMIKHKPNFLISNIEKIDVPDSSCSCCLCVGSVINYSDALSVVKEVSRIITSGGYLFLEFENSASFEFLLTRNYKKNAAIITTFYQCEEEKLWVYSEKYIKNILKEYGFKIKSKQRFHILSPFAYRLYNNPQKAAKWCWTDRFLRVIPISSNVVLVAQKLAI